MLVHTYLFVMLERMSIRIIMVIRLSQGGV